jgi:hypothetical protein
MVSSRAAGEFINEKDGGVVDDHSDGKKIPREMFFFAAKANDDITSARNFAVKICIH